MIQKLQELPVEKGRLRKETSLVNPIIESQTLELKNLEYDFSDHHLNGFYHKWYCFMHSITYINKN